MNTEHFTDSSQELINASANIAIGLTNPALLPLHLLAAGLENEFIHSFLTVLALPQPQLQELVTQEL